MRVCERVSTHYILAKMRRSREISPRQLAKGSTRTHRYTRAPPSNPLDCIRKEFHQSYSCCLHKSWSHLQDKWGSQGGQCILIKSQAPSSHPPRSRCPCFHAGEPDLLNSRSMYQNSKYRNTCNNNLTDPLVNFSLVVFNFNSVL